MPKAVYRITASTVDAVKVGSFLVDDDYGSRRDWWIYDPTAANLSVGFAGVRTDKVCGPCWNLTARKVARKGHPEPHGQAPTLVPTGALGAPA